ncbi:DUF423 domain-containing protein [Paenibacillus nanensis]|uniref:DUF423 domain-containing protein n=1 Tax=Paenibacillus nanensis TaxID=393251 RepID=A0A3A1UVV9_9BACL|nr:DUF423 domain-containing protein [Paenibacillus nanensis]RIX52414.1 DUF423 domain-containing protein [Paenibacillus nanensis]
MFPKYFLMGAVNAAIAIALGAFGAHGLEDRITDHYLDVFETGVRYHMYGALGLMLVAVMDKLIGGSRKAAIGGRLIFAGTLIFSLSLYILATAGITQLGMVTPIGGLAMLTGWGFVIAAAANAMKTKQ